WAPRACAPHGDGARAGDLKVLPEPEREMRPVDRDERLVLVREPAAADVRSQGPRRDFGSGNGRRVAQLTENPRRKKALLDGDPLARRGDVERVTCRVDRGADGGVVDLPTGYVAQYCM